MAILSQAVKTEGAEALRAIPKTRTSYGKEKVQTTNICKMAAKAVVGKKIRGRKLVWVQLPPAALTSTYRKNIGKVKR